MVGWLAGVGCLRRNQGDPPATVPPSLAGNETAHAFLFVASRTLDDANWMHPPSVTLKNDLIRSGTLRDVVRPNCTLETQL